MIKERTYHPDVFNLGPVVGWTKRMEDNITFLLHKTIWLLRDIVIIFVLEQKIII